MPDIDLESLETPAAIVDLERVEANLQRVEGYTRSHGLTWRPHAKTHKTPAFGAMQRQGGAVGVTVATLREAELMAGVVDDILLAYPPLGESKRRRLAELLGTGIRIAVGLDSPEALATVAAASREAGSAAGVLVEVDAGMRRVGVATPEAAVELAARARDSDGIEYRGIMFYPGHIRQVSGDDDPALSALSARLGEFVAALEATGLPPAVVSGGSTPTLWHSHRIAGLTEVRPGTNVFNDRTTAVIGACQWSDCAYSVLATVVSTAVPGQVVVDAGSKALAKEELRGEGGGYGALLDRPEVTLRALSEEHGVLDLTGVDWRPSVGARVRIVPNHVCVSVNLQERLWAVRDGAVVAEYEVAARGRGPTRLPAERV